MLPCFFWVIPVEVSTLENVIFVVQRILSGNVFFEIYNRDVIDSLFGIWE